MAKKTEFYPICGLMEHKTLSALQDVDSVRSVVTIRPVLPMLSRKHMSVPFSNCGEMLKFNKGNDLELWELALEYESARGAIAPDEVSERMRKLLHIWTDSLNRGLQGTEFPDRILPAQAPGFQEKMQKRLLIESPLLNRMILYVSALMEVKSSLGVIIAAPTAASCGVLPGAILATAESLKRAKDEAVKALIRKGVQHERETCRASRSMLS